MYLETTATGPGHKPPTSIPPGLRRVSHDATRRNPTTSRDLGGHTHACVLERTTFYETARPLGRETVVEAIALALEIVLPAADQLGRLVEAPRAARAETEDGRD